MSQLSQTELRKKLFAAAERGDSTEVAQLLAAGADVNARGPGQSTALEYAASVGHEKVVEVLINAGADVNAQDKDMHDALAFAAKGGYASIVRRLIKAGASVSTGLFQYDVLSLAAMYGHTEVVQALIAAGKKVNTKNGEKALAQAVQENHEATAIEIVRAGVRPESSAIAEQLIVAARNGLASLVRELLAAGVDPDFRDTVYLGQTAIEIARDRNLSDVVKVLEEHGNKPTLEKDLGQAAANGDLESVLNLLNKNADPNGRDANGDTPLCRAVEKRHHTVIHTLLERGANPNVGRPITVTPHLILGRKAKSQLPLYLAMWNGDQKAGELLLCHGATLNDSSIQCAAVYMVAFESDVQVAFVKWLLEKGLDPKSRLHGLTMKTLARERGHKELVNYLAVKASTKKV